MKNNNIIKKQIQQFLLGNLSITEEKQLLNWVEESSENMKFFLEEQQKLEIPTIQATYNSSIDNKWEKIKESLLADKYTPKTRAIYSRTKFIAIAASLVIGLVSYILINNRFAADEQKFVMVETRVGEKMNLTLPDGTEVNLNSKSKLTYPERFSKNERSLQLDGEAFFKVTHNAQKPFIVKTNVVNVKVLGTEFDLKAFPEEKVVNATLVKGKIRLEKEKDGKIFSLVEINPSERATYYADQDKIEVNKEDNLEKYIAWKDGKLVFMNAPIEEVVKKLELWYNVSVIVNSESLKQAHFTMTFTTESIEQVLNLLQISYPIKYTINKKGASSTPNAKTPDLEIVLSSN